AQAGRRSAGLARDRRVWVASADEPETVDRLEQLAAIDLNRNVVHPHPEAVLDPLEPRLGVDGSRYGHGRPHRAAPIPENLRILDTMGEFLSRHEFEIHVEEWRSIEAN